MTNAEALTLMMARLAGRSAVSTRALLLIELNEKIKQLEIGPLKPWFMEAASVGLTTTAAVQTSALPTDFIEEYEDGALRIADLDGVWRDPDPKKVSIEVLERETDGVDPALPAGYAIFGANIYWGPAPDQDYAYKLKYYKFSTAVVDDDTPIANPWLLNFFNFTTLATMHHFALLHLQGTDIANKIKPELTVAADQFARAVESRKHANMDYLLDDTEN